MDWLLVLVILVLERSSRVIGDLLRGFAVFSIVYWAVALVLWYYWWGGRELMKKEKEEEEGEVSW